MSDAPHPLLRITPQLGLATYDTPTPESEAAAHAANDDVRARADAQVSAPAELLRELLRDPERKGLSDEAIVAALGALAICDAIKEHRAPRGAPMPPLPGISRLSRPNPAIPPSNIAPRCKRRRRGVLVVDSINAPPSKLVVEYAVVARKDTGKRRFRHIIEIDCAQSDALVEHATAHE